MAHKMGAGSTKNTRDSQAKRLGVKCIGSQKVKSGFIIVRKQMWMRRGENTAQKKRREDDRDKKKRDGNKEEKRKRKKEWY